MDSSHEGSTELFGIPELVHSGFVTENNHLGLHSVIWYTVNLKHSLV